MLLRRSLSLYRVFDATSASLHARFSSTRIPVTVGIRREDPKRIWERRTPLTPDAVKELVHNGVNVEIEHCDRRVFRDEAYTAAGAQITTNLTNAHIILGIKETPLDEIITAGITPPTSSIWETKGYVKVPRTHLMFSHTAKGQEYNMPLLAKYLVKKDTSHARTLPRLIDYELLTAKEGGKRTVGFGWFAGVAGTLEALSSTAQMHLENGITTPFLATPRPHTHATIDSLQTALRTIGEQISQEGTPRALGPFVIGVTGTGNVAKGCLDILESLPIEKVDVRDLHELVKSPNTRLNKIYVTHAPPPTYLFNKNRSPYSRAVRDPHSYHSIFGDNIAPYLTLLLNGAWWQPGFPRLMDVNDLNWALTKAKKLEEAGGGKLRARNVGDISCDIQGGLEFLTQTTTLSSPFYKIDTSPSVQIMAVDILPASLPLDASVHFSKAVMPYLWLVVSEYMAGPQVGQGMYDLNAALDRATIAVGGELTKRHEVLKDSVETYWRKKERMERVGSSTEPWADVLNKMGVRPVDEGEYARKKRQREEVDSTRKGQMSMEVEEWRERSEKLTEAEEEARIKREAEMLVMKKSPLEEVLGRFSRFGKTEKSVLLLGSGMVARPAVEVISKREDVKLLIAGNSHAELERLGKEFSVPWRVVDVDVEKGWMLGNLIENVDVVISLLPVPFHIEVAKECLKYKKHLVTASYETPEMSALNAQAIEANVLFLNEVGLDPGIDHISALNLISRVKAENQVIKSFTSFCGGLPAPDVEHTPLRYKFSWNPRGVLVAGLNEARFLVGNQVQKIPQGSLFKNVFCNVPVCEDFELEGLANRDSLKYMEEDAYDVGSPRTFVRGTLRYPGFSSLMESFQSLGFLDSTNEIYLPDWPSFIRICIAQQLNLQSSNVPLPPDAISRLIPTDSVPALHSALEWLGLVVTPFPTYPRLPPLPLKPMYPLDIFAYLLSHRFAYKPRERDMVILSHELIAYDAAAQIERVYTSSLRVYGTEKESAMARTVGVPVGVAALLVVDGKIESRGVVRPLKENVFRPLLSTLEEMGLGMEESVKDVKEVVRTVESAVASTVGERKIGSRELE